MPSMGLRFLNAESDCGASARWTTCRDIDCQLPRASAVDATPACRRAVHGNGACGAQVDGAIEVLIAAEVDRRLDNAREAVLDVVQPAREHDGDAPVRPRDDGFADEDRRRRVVAVGNEIGPLRQIEIRRWRDQVTGSGGCLGVVNAAAIPAAVPRRCAPACFRWLWSSSPAADVNTSRPSPEQKHIDGAQADFHLRSRATSPDVGELALGIGGAQLITPPCT